MQLPLLHPSTIYAISTMVKNCDKLPWLKDALTHHYIGGKNLQGTGWSGAWGGFPPSYIEQIFLIK